MSAMPRVKFPIWAKVAAAFGVLLLFVAVVGAVSLNRLSAIDVRTVAARDDWVPSARSLGQLRTSVRQYRLAEAMLALAGSDAGIAAAAAGVRDAGTVVDEWRARCDPYITPRSDDERLMRDFDRTWAAYRAVSARFVASVRAPGAYDHEAFEAGGRYYEAATAQMTENIIQNSRTGLEGATETARFVHVTRAIVLDALLLLIGLSIGLAAALSATVSVPLQVMTVAMRRLAARDFSVSIPGAGRRDELGTMADAIEVFRASLVETEQLRAREDAQNAELRESEARFRTVFASVVEAIFVSDPATGRFVEVNSSGCELFGYTREELIGLDILSLSSGEHPYDRAAVMEWNLKARGQGPQTFEWRCKAKDGRVFWAEICVRLTRFGGRDVILATLRDISERKASEAQIRNLARFDALTGLPNRRVFLEAVGGARARAGRDGERFAVLFLDLDHFKDVNDTLGHPAGDELLRAVAGRLRGAVRQSDVVARFGGDEFAVLAAELHEAGDAAALADKLIASLEALFAIHGNDIRIGTSIGIALPVGGADVDKLMAHADVALYRAKSDGRGGYRFFDASMDAETRARVRLLADLRDAIADGQLFLKYQPQVELPGGRLIGVEALVRWRHPERGVLGPDKFIPAAESSGLIVGLGHVVLRDACRQARAWLDAGLLPATLAVNLSAAELRAPLDLEEFIVKTLADTELPPERLEIELTETILMQAGGALHAVLGRLRARGVRLAIDDFGTGFSSLDYLRRFPADRIKIARNFVSQIEQPGNTAVVKATIGLARELGMEVIAEGVETERQAELLAAWGCAEGQGYHYGQPLEVAELEPLLRRGAAGHDPRWVRPPELRVLRGGQAAAARAESLSGRYRRLVQRVGERSDKSLL
ncbi:MAG TPA: EAL domain-containing protein [Steroidobacteraceae bacterium]|nr:EAL domain-containing protein [Steroidobacteraceae bacterium]